MDWKKIGKNLIYPHLAIIIMFLPISIAFLAYCLIFLDSTSIISILSYLMAFYMLMVLCFRVPRVIEFCKKFKSENKYIRKISSDVHLRINMSLYGSLIFNCAFAIFQMGLGFYHKSFWFFSMSAYYVILAVMRFFILKHTRNFGQNEDREVELKKFVLCGWLLLVLNLALAVIVFFFVYWNKTFVHHEIVTIALASYTFLTFSFAIINLIRYRKYSSPIYSASKIISFVSACVSMLTLETTMLTTFGNESTASFSQIIMAVTGVVVIGVTLTLAVYMIVKGRKGLWNAQMQLVTQKTDCNEIVASGNTIETEENSIESDEN